MSEEAVNPSEAGAVRTSLPDTADTADTADASPIPPSLPSAHTAIGDKAELIENTAATIAMDFCGIKNEEDVDDESEVEVQMGGVDVGVSALVLCRTCRECWGGLLLKLATKQGLQLRHKTNRQRIVVFTTPSMFLSIYSIRTHTLLAMSVCLVTSLLSDFNSDLQKLSEMATRK